ncbi:MAG: TonB-dependent siderophore receptor [Fibrobacteres bacterium]|nr:TonB-dependent siderophore receptor [Fibrobacterota bacterium]
MSGLNRSLPTSAVLLAGLLLTGHPVWADANDSGKDVVGYTDSDGTAGEHTDAEYDPESGRTDSLPTMPEVALSDGMPESSGEPTGAILNLPSKEVRGRAASPGDGIDNTAFKIPMSLHETPRSLTVLGAERLREQNFRTVAQTMAYIPGLAINSNATEGYHYYARGQRMAAADTRVDGFAGIAAGGDFSPNLYGIEQVVALRGPAGLLYGASGAPGGLINLVSKKPSESPSRRADFRLGPFGGSAVGVGNTSAYGVDLDVTGPLTGDGRVLYRGMATLEDMSQYTANVLDKNRFAGLSLAYRLDAEGRYRFSPLVQFTRMWHPAGRGSAISPASSRATNDGREDLDFGDLSPMDVNLSAGGRQDDQILAGADFTAAPIDALKLRAGYRYLGYDTEADQFTPNVATLAQASPSDPESWTVQRRQAKSITERFNHGADLGGSYESRPASGWKNLAMAGANARYNGNDRSATATGGNQSAINIYTGAAATAPKDSNLALIPGFLAKSFAWNVYAQDQVSLADERWILTLGIGYGQEHPDRDYARTGIRPDTVKGLADLVSTRYGRPTPNAALVFNASKEWALYASYATSYTLPPGEREDRNGIARGFRPEIGANYEVGAKYDLPARAASLDLALFRNERTDVMVQSDVNDLNAHGLRYYTQREGEGILSRGVELGGEIRPVREWRLMLGAAYVHARNRSAIDPVADGAPADKTPEWSGSLFTRYDLAEGPLRGLGAGIGAIAQTERISAIRTAAAPDPLVFPWFARLDAGLYYRLDGNVDMALNVENLNDDRRVGVSGTTGTNVELAAPRRVSFRTSYRM